MVKTGTCTGTIDLQIHYSFVSRVTAFVGSILTQNIPKQNVDISFFDSLCNFVYADPHFQTSDRIDLIVGADVFEDIFPQKEINFQRV